MVTFAGPFFAASIFGGVGAPLLVAGEAFGDCGVSLLVACAKFGENLRDSRSAKLMLYFQIQNASPKREK